MINQKDATKYYAEANDAVVKAYRLKVPHQILADLSAARDFWQQYTVDQDEFRKQYESVMSNYKHWKSALDQS